MTLTKEGIAKLIKNLNLTIDIDPNKMTLLGIRGSSCGANQYMKELSSFDVYPKTIVEDKYNCTIIQIYHGELVAFLASTLPGKYYTDNPENPNGVARLTYGRWQFKRGLHKGNTALIQCGPMVILRDTNENYKDDFDTDKLDYGVFGINNHAAGGYDDIMKNSAGCQVIKGDKDASGNYRGWNSETWLTYIQRAYTSENTAYDYILIPYDWMANILLQDSKYCFFGSQGDLVEKISEKLALTVMPRFYGEPTVRKVIEFQKANNIKPNGYCGPTTLKSMGVI